MSIYSNETVFQNRQMIGAQFAKQKIYIKFTQKND